MKVAVFGSGYVGLVTGACLAERGHDVLCMDVDKKKVEMLKKGEIHFYEPGLKEYVKRNIEKKRIHFTTDPKEAVEWGNVLLNCVGTPGKEDGSANLDYIFDVAKSIAKHTGSYKVLITKSTVPPGTARKIDALMKKTNPKSQIDVVSNPEFLKEGAAVEDFNNPDRIIVGLSEENGPARKAVEELYGVFTRPDLEIIYTNWETAELIKYACNTFLATKVSFINEIANICDCMGANVKKVAYAMGLDARIGPKFLNAGVGYGGSCFPKDVRALVHYAKEYEYMPELLSHIDTFNEQQKKRVIEKIKASFKNNLKGKTIGVWGLSFKPGTSDMRDAPSIVIIKELIGAGAKIQAYDPVATEEAKMVMGETTTYCRSPEQAATDADALVLVTEWEEFKMCDLKKIKKMMKGTKFFDGRNVFSKKEMEQQGFEYHGMGQG